VFDDIERGRLGIKPAGKDAAPASVRLLHIDLDERAGEFLLFPRRRRLASPEAHDHVLPANRLARMKRDILYDAVALIKDCENRGSLSHRRNSALAIGGRSHLASARQRCILPRSAFAARGERDRGKQGCGDAVHAYSGIQGS